MDFLRKVLKSKIIGKIEERSQYKSLRKKKLYLKEIMQMIKWRIYYSNKLCCIIHKLM